METMMFARVFQQLVGLPLLFGIPFMVHLEAAAHAKGLYKTKAQAEQRAKELGCTGTHQNNGLWMPCGHEAELHHELRQE